ncbi:hypothetical protein FRB90_012287 [Tulasnella sp. 427]|nr:hypothetical protein FRB90_012287 [Tulasnella sp. 427]
MSESGAEQFEGLIEAWRERLEVFRIDPTRLAYNDGEPGFEHGAFGSARKATFTPSIWDQSEGSPIEERARPRTVKVAVKRLRMRSQTRSSRFEEALDAAEGLHYLHTHEPPICHGDIKGANVLVKKDGHAVLSNIGLAQLLDDDVAETSSDIIQRSTIRWTSPELLDNNGRMTPPSDVWSLGWLLWELVTGKIPFHSTNILASIIYHIVTLRLPACEDDKGILEMPALARLMRMCWQKDPASRLTINECINSLKRVLREIEAQPFTKTDQEVKKPTVSIDMSKLPLAYSPVPQVVSPTAFTMIESPVARTRDDGRILPTPIPSLPHTTRSIKSARPVHGKTLPPSLADAKETSRASMNSTKDLPPLPNPVIGSPPHVVEAIIPEEHPRPYVFTLMNSPSARPSGRAVRNSRPDPRVSLEAARGTDSSSSSRGASFPGLLGITKSIFRTSKKQKKRSSEAAFVDIYQKADHDHEYNPWDALDVPHSDINSPSSATDGSGRDTSEPESESSNPQILRLQKTIQRLESTQSQYLQDQREIKQYLSHLGQWLSQAPLFGAPAPGLRLGAVGIPSMSAPIIPATAKPAFSIASSLNSESFVDRTSATLGQEDQSWLTRPPGRRQPIHGRPKEYNSVNLAAMALRDSMSSPDSIPRAVGSTASESGVSDSPTQDFVASLIDEHSGCKAFREEEIKLIDNAIPETERNVVKGTIVATRQVVSIKVLDLLVCRHSKSRQHVVASLTAWMERWTSREHANIAKLAGRTFIGSSLAIVGDWYPSGNIVDYLSDHPHVDRKSLLRQAAEGLAYLHQKPTILHSNLKPSNVLVEADGTIKLSDVGIALFLTLASGANVHGKPGDVRWTAPEILEGELYSSSADVYAFGCLALALLKDKIPYSTFESDVAVSKAIYRGEFPNWRRRIAAFRINPEQLTYVDEGKVVASGGFGQVRKATYASDVAPLDAGEEPAGLAADVTVAVKTLQIHMKVDKERLEKRFIREAYVWSQLKNDNIIDFLGFYFSSNDEKTEALLICPWMENGQSAAYVTRQGLSTAERLQLLLDAAKGIGYLHSRVPPICHGDIKGSNVLIKDDGHAAICDFGLAQVLDEEFERLASQTIHRGTVRWTSPERLDDDGPLAPSSDVWSWAWLIWEIMTEQIPFHHISHSAAVIFHIITLKLPPYEQASGIADVPTLPKLLQLCWQREPESRLPMEECIDRLENILEGFGTPQKDEAEQGALRMVDESAASFAPVMRTNFAAMVPPALDLDFADSSETWNGMGSYFSAIPELQPGPSVSRPSADAGKHRPPRPINPRKDLPPIPGQDTEPLTSTATNYSDSKEPQTDSTPSAPAKPAATPIHYPSTAPPSSFRPKSLVPINPPSIESSNKSSGSGFRTFTQRILRASRRKTKSKKGPDDAPWDWDFIGGQPQPVEDPRILSEPSAPVHVQNEKNDTRDRQIEYIFNALKSLEASRTEQDQKQRQVEAYLGEVSRWLSGAPRFGPLYDWGPPIAIPQAQVVSQYTGDGFPPISVSILPQQVIFQPPFIPGPPNAFIPPNTPDRPVPIVHSVHPHVVTQMPSGVPRHPRSEVNTLSSSSSRDDQDFFVRARRSPHERPVVPPPLNIAGQPIQIPPSGNPVGWRPPSATDVPKGPKSKGGPREPARIIISPSFSPSSPLGSLPSVALSPVPSEITNEEGVPVLRRFDQDAIRSNQTSRPGGEYRAYTGTVLETAESISIKPLKLASDTKLAAIMSDFEHWLRRWGSPDHDNVLEILGAVVSNGVPAVISRCCADGNIADYLEKKPQADRRELLRQVAEGIHYIHNRPHYATEHTNLKPNNVLIADGKVKLSDETQDGPLLKCLRAKLAGNGRTFIHLVAWHSSSYPFTEDNYLSTAIQQQQSTPPGSYVGRMTLYAVQIW